MNFFLNFAYANSLTLDLGSGAFSARAVQLLLLMSVLALGPMLIIMMTSFTRFVIVFSFLRNAIGTQQSPPNMVMTGLALFMTLFVMEPTLKQIHEEAIAPLLDGKIQEEEALEKGMKPLHRFMYKNTREKDLQLFFSLAKIPLVKKSEDTPIKVLLPSFVIGELRRAFEIGFLVFLPFLVIDIAVASILMSLGMMMIPPAMISLPFKLIFFVLMDGWGLLCSSLVNSVK